MRLDAQYVTTSVIERTIAKMTSASTLAAAIVMASSPPRGASPRGARRSPAPSARATTRVGERVVRALGAAQVHEAEREDHDELRQREAVADGQPLVDGALHEVGRVAREQDEADVPGEKEDRRRQDEAPACGDQLAELRRPLDLLPVDVRIRCRHALPLSLGLCRFAPTRAAPDVTRTRRRDYSGILRRPRRPAEPLLPIAFCALPNGLDSHRPSLPGAMPAPR